MDLNLTECAVCLDNFKVPKILPCGHLLCRDCLVMRLQTQPQAACPICRCVIADPKKQGGRSVEEVADGLPTDLVMTAMVEAETLLSKQHACCICEDVAAVAVCLQCRDVFCQKCCNVHTKQAATQSHEVGKLSSLTTEMLAAHQPATCPNHEGEISQVYCATHQAAICTTCATTVHRSCKEVVSLQRHVDDLTSELAELSHKLNEEAAKADDASLHSVNQQWMQQRSQAALKEMEIVCDCLTASIDARLEELKHNTLGLVSESALKIHESRKQVFLQHKKMADLCKKFSRHRQFADMFSMIKGQIQQLDLDRSLSNSQLDFNVVITIDPNTTESIKKSIASLGEIEILQGNNNNSDQTSLPRDDGSVLGSISIDIRFTPVWCEQTVGLATRCAPMTANPSRSSDMKTRTSGDPTKPHITCLAVVPSGQTLYMADKTNKSVKVFSLKSSNFLSTGWGTGLIANLPLEEQPLGLALSVTNNLLAVTHCNKTFITLVDISTSNKPFVRSVIETGKRYTGIDVVTTNDDGAILVVSCSGDDAGPASVDMITLTGEWIRSVVTSETLPSLSEPAYLHVDARRGALYVSDKAASCVFCLDLRQGGVRRLTHSILAEPGQVTTDSEGHLYLTSYYGVLVRSADNAWRVMIRRQDLGEEEGAYPLGVVVTDTVLVVSSGKIVRKYYLA